MNSAQEPFKIERTIVLRAPRSRVWRALTDGRMFAEWFGVTIEGEFAPGAAVHMVTTHPGFAGIHFTLWVERMEPEHTFTWKWHPGSEQPGPGHEAERTDVSFTLEEVAEGTRLTAIESGFDRISLARRAKVYQEIVGGWDGQLAALEAYVRGQS